MNAPIVGPEELAALDSEVRLVDVRTRSEWDQGHLRGAVSADLEAELSCSSDDPAQGGRHPLPDLSKWCQQLGHWGIGPSTRVVAYDAAGGANAAARFWWMLRAVGHERVSVLDGGLQAAAQSAEVTTEDPDVGAVEPYPVPEGGGWHVSVVSMEELEVRRRDPDVCVIDVRTESRYQGASDPFDPNPGHVPGAVNRPYATNLDAQGRWRPPSELRSIYDEVLDGRRPQDTIVYCGSGVTACHTLLALEAAGLPGAKLYVGSWSEWGRSQLPRGTVVSEDR